MTADVHLLRLAMLVMLASPAALTAALAVSVVLRLPLGERGIGLLTRGTMLVSFGAALVALVTYVGGGAEPRVFSFGTWFSAGEGGFAFDFLADGLSLSFAVLTTGICGIVAAFSNRYLHREPGYTRYFVLFAIFTTGITLVAVAGSIEVLFAGWELLGLSSALLVGFFHERRAPVANARRVFAVYRVSDAAMLSAAVLLHHWAGSGSLSMLFSGHGGASSPLAVEQATLISVLLIAAVAGKSALLPFSGWLPRAMEGPTPSSAVYYGALSIHAGCFLLLRAEPLLAQSELARLLAAAVGAATALYASFCARAQTDVKSALAYAALTQVGIIVVEIAFGLTTLAFVHIVGHTCFRLLQLLSAPNILHDLHALENALRSDDEDHQERRSLTDAPAEPRWPHLLGLERGFLDATIDRLVVAPLLGLARALDRFDRMLCGPGGRGDGSKRAPPP